MVDLDLARLLEQLLTTDTVQRRWPRWRRIAERRVGASGGDLDMGSICSLNDNNSHLHYWSSDAGWQAFCRNDMTSSRPSSAVVES
ncbi:hypothetical protein ACFQAT_04335 [Undibacterium arcticum]|uniref:hypothetical protein n=1 Tax=Undibacterium arcticum TaxID=1762892 RepID=UPI00360A4430